MERLRLWFRGWFFYFRAIYKVRAKKHGKGPMEWRYALLMARSARFIVYGQHYYRPRKATLTAGNST